MTVVDLRPEPACESTERTVLSALMVDPTALSRVRDFLRPIHFHWRAHEAIARAQWALSDMGSAVDPETVGRWLRARGELGLVGGNLGMLTELLLATPNPAHVRDHAKLVFDDWRKRQMRLVLTKAAARLDLGETGDTQEFFEKLLGAVTKIAQNEPDRKFKTNEELCGEYLRNIAQVAKSGHSRAASIPLGLRGFDEHTGGLILGQKTTVAALTGVGKTHFAVQAMVAAARQGIGSILYSTELSDEEFAARELSHLAGVNAKRLELTRAGIPSLTQDDWDRVVTHARSYEGFPILVDDRSSITVDQICADVRRWSERFHAIFKRPLGLVVVDYIQRLTPPEHMKRAERRVQIDYATIALTKLAKELKLSVVELAQQATPERGKAHERPNPFDIADCKTSAKEAQCLLFIYRPDKHEKRRVNLYLAKMRGGEEAEWCCELDGATSRFTEVA